MRELRKQKEGREREYRVSNHLKYREKVFNMAKYFLAGTEKVFKVGQGNYCSVASNTSSSNSNSNSNNNNNNSNDMTHEIQACASAYQVRVLFSRFLELREEAEHEYNCKLANTATTTTTTADAIVTTTTPIKGWGDHITNIYETINIHTILDEAFLLDSTTSQISEEQLFRFDSLPSNDNVYTDTQFVLEWATQRIGMYGVALNGTREDLAPRAGQLVYAMYVLHCSKCTVPTNICPFPGCGCIRLQAAACTQETLLLLTQTQSETESNVAPTTSVPNLQEFATHLESLKTTGNHPIEIAVKRYLLQGRHINNTMLPVYCNNNDKNGNIKLETLRTGYTQEDMTSGLSPAEEITNELLIDQQEIKRLEDLEYLRINWKALKQEAQYLRYISRRLVSPSVYECIDCDDILKAQGGVNYINDEITIGIDNIRNVCISLPFSTHICYYFIVSLPLFTSLSSVFLIHQLFNHLPLSSLSINIGYTTHTLAYGFD